MGVPTTTLAAVTTGSRASELRTLPLPPVGDDGALLQVEAAGVCGSDVVAYRADLPERVMGHENVGRLVAVGAGAARRWGVVEGDRVAVEEYLPCGHCRFCRTAEFRLCLASDQSADPDALRYGATPLTTPPGVWGGFSQYLPLHERTVLHPLPDVIPAELATLALPLANGYEWACAEGGAAPGRAVVVIGPGQQGLGCVLAARVAGADPVICLGRSTDGHRLRVSERLGATHTVDVDRTDPVAEVERITGGALADLVVDAAAGSARTVNQAIAMTRKRGTIVTAVSAPAPLDAVNFGLLSRKYLTVRGVRGHSYQSVERAIALIGDRGAALADLASIAVGLDGVHDAILGTGGELATPVIHATVLPWKG